MNPNIDYVLNVFYQRGITAREQLLTEVLRVKRTLEVMNKEDSERILKDNEKLFHLMKKNTEEELGFFPGDRDFFIKVFELCKDVDLINFTLEVYKNDRLGMIISPEYLTKYVYTYIDEYRPETILITEAEKHLSGLRGLVQRYPEKEFTFTTSYPLMNMMLGIGFQGFKNVEIKHQSIYQELLIDKKFDLVYCLPTFAGKAEELNSKFITNQTDGIAIENSLRVLSEYGSLVAVVPAKITFTGGSFATLREHIVSHYSVDSIFILPEGTFRPYSAIKTYMFLITKSQKEVVDVGTLDVENDSFKIAEKKSILREVFLKHEDWRIEILLSDDDENIKKYKLSDLKRVKIKEVAEVFRGKSILKKDTKPGKVSVLNISNIEDGEINYIDLDTIDEEERKVKRYELVEGDLILTCRGTSVKVAVFQQQKNIIIASANVIVIRPQEGVLGEYIKMFFESPIGTTLIKSFQRGTTIMNINHNDITEMEIPLLSLEEQKKMIEEYRNEFRIYKETIKQAEERWQKAKNKLYDELY